MNAPTDLSTLMKQRNDRLAALPLRRDRTRLAEQSTNDTHAALIPSPLLDSLALTPEEGDAHTGAIALFQPLVERSEKLARELWEGDLSAVDQGLSTSSSEIARPLGYRETVFPLYKGGQLYGILWSGKYRTDPFTAEELHSAGSIYQLDDTQVDTLLAHPPLMTPDERDRHLRVLASLSAALHWALSEHARYEQHAVQLMESERVRALGTLSGGIAHHFNNLLSVILGYSSHLLNRAQLPEEADEPLHQISEAAQKGRRLTEEILSFAGSDVEQETTCSLHNIVESVLSLLEGHISAKVKVSRKFDATHDTIRTQRSVLHQTVFNLLINSVDSMPESGHIEVRTANQDVPDDVGTPVTHIKLEVLDTGIHVPETTGTTLEPVSEPDQSVSPDNGYANRSEVLFPLDREIVPAVETPKRRKRLTSNIIWVVDDDPIFCEMCERVLSDDGHVVATIESGPALHEEWAKSDKKPSLLIIDFSMPDYNGLELCTWLREQGSRAPVILVSGFSHNQPDIHAALKMRKTYFLQKPFPVPELADMVTVALGETLLGQ